LHAWSPMQSVGYKEVQLYLDGQIKKDELIPLIVTSTMQLAKQQMTWFKRDPSTLWFDSDTQWKEAVKSGRELLTPS
jgi:tRNA dimethylallyltransferase